MRGGGSDNAYGAARARHKVSFQPQNYQRLLECKQLVGLKSEVVPTFIDLRTYCAGHFAGAHNFVIDNLTLVEETAPLNKKQKKGRVPNELRLRRC